MRYEWSACIVLSGVGDIREFNLSDHYRCKCMVIACRCIDARRYTRMVEVKESGSMG